MLCGTRLDRTGQGAAVFTYALFLNFTCAVNPLFSSRQGCQLLEIEHRAQQTNERAEDSQKLDDALQCPEEDTNSTGNSFKQPLCFLFFFGTVGRCKMLRILYEGGSIKPEKHKRIQFREWQPLIQLFDEIGNSLPRQRIGNIKRNWIANWSLEPMLVGNLSKPVSFITYEIICVVTRKPFRPLILVRKTFIDSQRYL